MYGAVVLCVFLSLWLLVLVPTVSAETVCRKDWRGKVVCKARWTTGTKVGAAVGIVLCVLVVLIVGLVLFVRRNRAEARTREPEMCQVEDSQVQGPEPVYEGNEATFPRPEPAVHAEHERGEYPRSAPATRVRFKEDLQEEDGRGEAALAVPRTAFVSRGFPRPLYTSMPREERGGWY